MPTNKRKREKETDELVNPDEVPDQNQLSVNLLDEPAPKRIKVQGYDVNIFPEDNEDLMCQAAAAFAASKARNSNPTADGLRNLGYKGTKPQKMSNLIMQLRKQALYLLEQVDEQIQKLKDMQDKLDEKSADSVKEFIDATCDSLATLNVAVEQLTNNIFSLIASKDLPEFVKQNLQNLMNQITTTSLEDSISDFIRRVPEEKKPLISELCPATQQLLIRIFPEVYSLPTVLMIR